MRAARKGGRVKKGRLGGFRGAGKKAAWVGLPNLFYPPPTPDVPLCVIVMMRMMRMRMTPAATSGAHNGLAGWCRQGSIMDAGPHWEGQTKYKGWDDWSECYTLLRRRGFGGEAGGKIIPLIRRKCGWLQDIPAI